MPGLPRRRALGRRGGRKPAMGPAEIKRAKAMLADPTITVEEVAQQIGVQPSTLYRHIPGGRSSLRGCRIGCSLNCARPKRSKNENQWSWRGKAVELGRTVSV